MCKKCARESWLAPIVVASNGGLLEGNGKTVTKGASDKGGLNNQKAANQEMQGIRSLGSFPCNAKREGLGLMNLDER